jgi:amino acid transporter
MTARPEAVHESSGGLATNSLSAVQVAVFALAASGPAASMALVLPAMAGFAGEALVFAFVLTTVVLALLTNTFVEFSKRLPSAGSLLAWNSAGFGPNVGFVFGWFFLGGYIMIACTGISAFGGFFENFLQANFDISVPWWVFSVACAAYVVVLAWTGVTQTVKSALILLALELGIIVALCISLVLAGHSELTVAPFTPSVAPGGWAAIGLALTFGVLSVIGYEEAATMAEEAKDSRRTVSRGLWMAGTGLSLFFLVVSYIFVTSYGPVDKFAADPLAAETMAHRVWGSLGGVMSLVVILSCLALAQTAFNAGLRVLFSLARVNVLPARFARTHPKFKTPSAAIVLFTLLTIPLTFITAGIAGPLTVFGYFGFMTAVSFLIMYAVTNVSLIRYALKDPETEFHLVRHGLLPTLALLGVLYPLYRTLAPLPPSPLPTLLLVLAIWVLVGGCILAYVRTTRRAEIDDVAHAFDEVADGHR